MAYLNVPVRHRLLLTFLAIVTALEEQESSAPTIRLTQSLVSLTHNAPVHVEFRCVQSSTVVGVDVRVATDSQPASVVVFAERWICGTPNATQRRTARIRLPAHLAYRPAADNRYSIHVRNASIDAWMLDPVAYADARAYRKFYDAAGDRRDRRDVSVVSPWRRPRRPDVTDRCPSWWEAIRLRLPYRPVCPAELEIFHAIWYPVALSGTKTGVHRVLLNYKNAVLKRRRQQMLNNPAFTFSLWLYVNNYCPHTSLNLCSIIQHITWDDRYATPQIFFTRTGKIFLQLVTETSAVRYYTTPDNFIVPRNEWVLLMLTCSSLKCTFSMRLMSHWSLLRVHNILLAPEDILYFDDTVGLLVFGGSEQNPSFQGYIGQAVLYRHKAITAHQVAIPSPNHAMFKLGLSGRDERCQNFIQAINSTILRTQAALKSHIANQTCVVHSVPLLRHNMTGVNATSAAAAAGRGHHWAAAASSGQWQCQWYEAPVARTARQLHQPVHWLARHWVLTGRQFDLSDIADVLVGNATALLETRGLLQAKDDIILLLKQASCFGNHDATFMLSVILNYGLDVKSNELQAHSYLMYGAMDGNRLCALALGNKHAFGLDGVPADYDQGYVYYKQTADKTKVDLDEHHHKDVFTEMVRLTNENALREHTEEDGDLFLWFKHQASQGIVGAQQNMARMLYWGSQGIARDVNAALEYYRRAAASGNAQALFDYGIVLLKGHGTKANMSLALEQLERAAAFNHSGAINALGWHSLEIKRNFTEAAQRFERSHQLGNKDGSHNLGHMWYTGRNAAGVIDRIKAFEYFAAGAIRGQFESGIMIAMFNMRGHPMAQRNPWLALDWARYVAERNPSVGKLLTRGVRAFRTHNWLLALVYYAMGASTGVEVANFNLAYLCETNYEVLTPHTEKECVWRHYNLSTQRIFHNVDPYVWIKMGAYYANGYGGRRQPYVAVEMYRNAAVRGDSQGLYRLAEMIEDGFGFAVGNSTLSKLKVPASVAANNVTLVLHLYSRCSEWDRTEAFLPCYIAWCRVYAGYLWTNYFMYIMAVFLLAISSTVVYEVVNVYRFVRRNTPDAHEAV